MTSHPKEFPGEWNARIFVWCRITARAFLREYNNSRKKEKKRKIFDSSKFHSFGTKKKFYCSFFFFFFLVFHRQVPRYFFALCSNDNKFSLLRSKNISGVLIIFNEGKETRYKDNRLNNESTSLFPSIIIIYSKNIFTPNNVPITFPLISNYRNRICDNTDNYT